MKRSADYKRQLSITCWKPACILVLLVLLGFESSVLAEGRDSLGAHSEKVKQFLKYARSASLKCDEGHHKGVLKACQMICKMDANYIQECTSLVGRSYLNSGHYAQAVDCFRIILSRYGRDADTVSMLDEALNAKSKDNLSKLTTDVIGGRTITLDDGVFYPPANATSPNPEAAKSLAPQNTATPQNRESAKMFGTSQ